MEHSCHEAYSDRVWTVTFQFHTEYTGGNVRLLLKWKRGEKEEHRFWLISPNDARQLSALLYEAASRNNNSRLK